LDPGPSSANAPAGTSPLDVVRLLRAGGGTLLDQVLLHAQLARVEWQQEKQRLLAMLAIGLLGFAGLLCALLSGGGLLMALTWNTAWRLPTLAALVLLYATGAAVAWRRLRAMSAQGDKAFAASRAALAADVALLKASL
jgi:uncharacterized membrane protein YqjE